VAPGRGRGGWTTPGFGATDQAGMERVALNVSQDHQQMVIILDRKSGTIQ
jgi:hypothetical protein